MAPKELTKEQLVEAANDLNKVLELNPKIDTEFKSTEKGAALKNQEKKFVERLEKDLVEVATGKDDKGVALLQPTDKVTPATVDVLEALKVEGIREKMAGKEAPAAKGGKAKKGAAAKGGKKAPVAEEKKKDQFGFREGSRASLFAKMIVDAGKTGTTMEAVKKAKWNENSATYFGTLAKMKKTGRVKVVEGKILFVK